MLMTTDTFVFNPRDEEEDDLAMACCHGSNGDLFMLARFPDEDEVDITFVDNTIHVDSKLMVTFSADRLLLEIAAEDAAPLGGETRFEIEHGTPADELADLAHTLRIILTGVGTFVSEVG
jgi:hypothetical protein